MKPDIPPTDFRTFRDAQLGLDCLQRTATPMSFSYQGQEMCRIDEDGTFRVNVDPTDSNARKFIELINDNLLLDSQLLTAVKELGG